MTEKMMPPEWRAKHIEGFMERFVSNATPPELTKRPSVESLWQAFWETPHDEREWIRPKDVKGNSGPMTLISFKAEVVRRAFELDEAKPE